MICEPEEARLNSSDSTVFLLTLTVYHGIVHLPYFCPTYQFKNWSVSSLAIGLVRNLSEYYEQLSNFDPDLPLKVVQVSFRLYGMLKLTKYPTQ